MRRSKDEIAADIRAITAAHLGVDEQRLQAESSWDDLAVDSLELLTLGVALETGLEVRLDLAALGRTATLGEAALLIITTVRNEDEQS